MKALYSFVLLAILASGCSEKNITPENHPEVAEDGKQPPKNNCTGLPNCK